MMVWFVIAMIFFRCDTFKVRDLEIRDLEIRDLEISRFCIFDIRNM